MLPSITQVTYSGIHKFTKSYLINNDDSVIVCVSGGHRRCQHSKCHCNLQDNARVQTQDGDVLYSIVGLLVLEGEMTLRRRAEIWSKTGESSLHTDKRAKHEWAPIVKHTFL